MFNLEAVFSYQSDIQKVSGNKIGLEIEAHEEDLKKIKPFLVKIKEDSSLPSGYKEGITYPLDLFEAFSLIFFIKNNFEYVDYENLGLHIHFNILDRNLEISKLAALRFKEEISFKVKYKKAYIPYFRDNNPYSNWLSKEKYHVINLKEATVEFRGMGLKKLKSLNKIELEKFFMFIETFLYYIRLFENKETLDLFWHTKIDKLKGTYYLLSPQETLEYVLFNKEIEIKTLVLNENLKKEILKAIEKKNIKHLSWTTFKEIFDMDFKLIRPILAIKKILTKAEFEKEILSQKYALKNEVNNILCAEL